MTPLIYAALALSGITFPGPGGYQYTNYTPNVKSATITVNSTSVAPGGHESVWLDVEDRYQTWLQVGVTDRGQGLVAYAETGSVQTVTSTRDLGRVQPGQSVNVRITYSPRHGWVGWVDGKPVVSERLDQGVAHILSGEDLGGGSESYTLTNPTFVKGAPNAPLSR